LQWTNVFPSFLQETGEQGTGMERNLVSDIEKVYQVWREYGAALRERNTRSWLSLWAENGLRIPPGDRNQVGLSQLQLFLESQFKLVHYHQYFINPEEVHIMGDHAYTHGLFESTVESIAKGKSFKICGKFLAILTKDRDGSWKIAVDCFNTKQTDSSADYKRVFESRR